jgi:hypothetical protein
MRIALMEGGEFHTFMDVPRMPARLAPTKTAIDLHTLHSIYCRAEPLKYQHRNIQWSSFLMSESFSDNPVLKAFVKLRKAIISFVTHVSLFGRMKQRG